MPIRVFFAAVVLIFALALPARAADAPDPLPDQIAVHIAVKSVNELLSNVDTYVAAASKGTANAVPPGFVAMMAQFSLPVPFDSWDSDEALHVIVPRAADDDAGFVAVFGTPDFSAFIASLEERGWEAGDGEAGKGDYADARSVVMPGGEAVVVADLGEGRAAIGPDVQFIADALNGWTPALASDADIVARFGAADSGFMSVRETILDALSEKTEEFVEAVTAAGFKPDAAMGLIALVEKAVPSIMDEFSAVQSSIVELRFADDAETIVLGTSGLSSPGALAHEMAQALTGAAAVDTAVCGLLPPGAMTVWVNAPLPDLLPDAENRLTRLVSAIYGGIAPEYGDESAALVAKFMDGEPGQSASGSYVDGLRQYAFTVNMAKDPEAMLAAMRGGFDLANAAWASAIADPGLGFELAGETRGGGEGAYSRHRFVFADEAKFQALLDRMNDGEEDVFDVQQFKKFNFYLAKIEGGIVVASGELTDEEFLAGLAGIRSPSGQTLLVSDGAKALLAAMPAAQAAAGIMDAGAFTQLYTVNLVRASEPEQAAAFEEIMKKMRASANPDENLIGFSVGADKGRLTCRLLVPAGAVSRIFRDIEELHPFLRPTPAARAPEEGEPEPEAEEEEEGPAEGEEDPSAA